MTGIYWSYNHQVADESYHVCLKLRIIDEHDYH